MENQKRQSRLARRTEDIFPTEKSKQGYQAKKAGYVWTLRELAEHELAERDAWVRELTTFFEGCCTR